MTLYEELKRIEADSERWIDIELALWCYFAYDLFKIDDPSGSLLLRRFDAKDLHCSLTLGSYTFDVLVPLSEAEGIVNSGLEN